MTALDLSRSTSGVHLTPEQSNEIWTGVLKQSAVTQLATGVKLPVPAWNTILLATCRPQNGLERPMRSRSTSRPSVLAS